MEDRETNANEGVRKTFESAIIYVVDVRENHNLLRLLPHLSFVLFLLPYFTHCILDQSFLPRDN